MDWTASVLSTVSSDTEPSVLITFDSAKYLFNAGENTSRSFLQSKQNYKRTRSLFFTQLHTRRIGGLPGLLMTFADSTIQKLDIVGPSGIVHALAAMRLYTFRDTMPVNIYEAALSPTNDPEPLYKDENITVYTFPILPTHDNRSSEIHSTTRVQNDDPKDLSRKRKRTNSLSTTQKRPGYERTELSDKMKLSGFNPGSLVGENAQEYRKLMIHTMFPGTRIQEKQLSKTKTHAKKRTLTAPNLTPIDSIHSVQELESSIAGNTDEVEVEVFDDYKRFRPKVPKGFHSQLPTFEPAISPRLLPALAYIVVGPRIRGKFDAKKAEELGVFKHHRSQLAKGIPVTVKSQEGDEIVERTVYPEECIGKSEPPAVAIILDVPTPSHIPSLISSFNDLQFFSKFRSQKPGDPEYRIRSIFHICGDGVLEDERYATFMKGFQDPHTNHIVASRKHTPNPVTFTSAAYNQLRLNQLDPIMFPIPEYSLIPIMDLATIPNLPSNTFPMMPSLSVNMRSADAPEIKGDDMDPFHGAITSGSVRSELSPLTVQKFDQAIRSVSDVTKTSPFLGQKGADVGVLPLGTGSALPTKYRNVSSTLIQIPHWGNVLLDAGEGTWGQLCRRFGNKPSTHNVWDMLRNLRCIYISHIHADHHLGLARILQERRQLDPPPEQPLYLVAIRSVHLYLRELSDIHYLGLSDETGNGVIPILSEALHWKMFGKYVTSGLWQIGGDEPWTDITISQERASEMCRTLGLNIFLTVDVYHRVKCYGAIMKHRDGWSIVFSGDTQPTDNLVEAGQGATLLIHEATMANDQVEMAKRKAHSTFGQAIDIGQRMNAENILLTHFSARYPKMPPEILGPKANDGQSDSSPGSPKIKKPVIALAFDHADMTIGNMWKMNRYIPAIEQNFKDTMEDDDDQQIENNTGE